MKIKVTLSIGLVGCEHKDEIDIPDEELEGMSAEEIDARLDEEWKEWAWNYIDGGATIIKDKVKRKP